MLAALPDKFRHIVIEGPIGAGKTSLARRLATLINLQAPEAYTATSDAATLVLFNRAGHRFALADLLVIDNDRPNGECIFNRRCDWIGRNWRRRGQVPATLRSIERDL